MSFSSKIQEALSRLPSLPNSAHVPIGVAAVHDGVSEKTVRRTYPLVELSPRRKGVPLSYLRRSKSAA